MKIGILGGTFDPVHNAHLVAAQTVRTQCNLDEVWFMPTSIPPHKTNREISKVKDRLSMLRLAMHGQEGLDVSTIELDRTGITYTVHTLQLLQIQQSFNPICAARDEFYYIIGADVVFDLLQWKDCARVFQLCQFIAMMRPGFDRAKFDAEIKLLKYVHGVKITCVDIPQMDTSSSEIRSFFLENRAAEAATQLPKEVFDYIMKHELYK